MKTSSLSPLNSALLVVLMAGLAGCASTSGTSATSEVKLSTPKRVFPELQGPVTNKKAILAVNDPLESFNRTMYNFNTNFDRYVFLPVLSGYQFVMPDIAEEGVSNFFDNLGELRNFYNNLLQGELTDTAVTVGRFAVNTTVGILGLWDPASHIGMNERREDFGQTLGKWGVGRGAYLVLPIFGPSSVRDTAGLATDNVIKQEVDMLGIYDNCWDTGCTAYTALEAVDERRGVGFRYYETGTPFEYELVRYANTRMRQILVNK